MTKEDSVAKLAFAKFRSLPKTMKPLKPIEWTVLASIIMEKVESKEMEVVALATGTKCLGASSVRSDGRAVHDCHAEVLCRRRFVLFLLDELERVFSGKLSDVFNDVTEEKCVRFRRGVCFHLYVSQAPCGDSCIFPLQGTKGRKRLRDPVSACDVECHGAAKRLHANFDNIHSKEQKHTDEIDYNRTGGKPVPGEPADPHDFGAQYHTLGILRTKPGRGDRTKSMCCSDKIARWSVLGLQGGLLSCFLPESEKARFASITVSELFDEAAMRRAFIDRVKEGRELNKGEDTLEIMTTSLCFEHSQIKADKEAEKIRQRAIPSSLAVSWSRGRSNAEVLLAKTGLRNGTSKKVAKIAPTKVQSVVCKARLFQLFRKLCSVCPPSCSSELVKRVAADGTQKITYGSVKNDRSWYQLEKKKFHTRVFHNWPSKPKQFYNF